MRRSFVRQVPSVANPRFLLESSVSSALIVIIAYNRWQLCDQLRANQDSLQRLRNIHEQDNQPRKRIRVTICGPSCAGKTTVFHRLRRHDHRSRRLAAKLGTLSDKEDETVEAKISAMGEFELSQQIDLENAKPPLHLLVEDLPDGSDRAIMELLYGRLVIDEPPDVILLCIPFYLLSGSGMERDEDDCMTLVTTLLDRWLDCLRQIFSMPNATLAPQVIPVFTFKDKVSSSFVDRIQERLKAKLKHLKSQLKLQDATVELLYTGSVIFLDARKSKNYGKLRHELDHVAKAHKIQSVRPVPRLYNLLAERADSICKMARGGTLHDLATDVAIKYFAAVRNRDDLVETIQWGLR